MKINNKREKQLITFGIRLTIKNLLMFNRKKLLKNPLRNKIKKQKIFGKE